MNYNLFISVVAGLAFIAFYLFRPQDPPILIGQSSPRTCDRTMDILRRKIFVFTRIRTEFERLTTQMDMFFDVFNKVV